MANYVEPQSASECPEQPCAAMAARFDVRARAEEIAMWRAGARRDGCRSVSGWARKLLNQRVFQQTVELNTGSRTASINESLSTAGKESY